MVLAHLDLIGRKDAEEALLAVDDDAADGVSSFLYTVYGILVVLIRLALYEPKPLYIGIPRDFILQFDP